MKLLIALLICFGALVAHAQAPARAVPSDSAIHVTVLQQGRYSHLLYTVNQEPLTGATLKALLNRYSPAAAELRKGRAQLRWGLALLPVMVAAFLVSKHQADRDSGPGSAFSKAPVPVSLLLGAFGGYAYLMFRSNHYDKAIEIYNQRFH
ncbi:hypothetical protein [Hymenobacter coccineus]|uniref:Uncharacterized protein n=1 Tax=Hymenobacter coccineus TaxID=1908235 RepID=A0A1G1SW96_9BACT|nr:hypothetical protein [Hymenobacter coccineus]OGX82897.1 hypothetical protein BEN49_13160 [Hymenobacter coccineus]